MKLMLVVLAGLLQSQFVSAEIGANLVSCQAALHKQLFYNRQAKNFPGMATEHGDVILPMKDGKGVVIYSKGTAFNCPPRENDIPPKFRLRVNDRPWTYAEYDGKTARFNKARAERIKDARDITEIQPENRKGYVTLWCDKTKTDQKVAEQYLLETINKEIDMVKEIEGPNISAATAMYECSNIAELEEKIRPLRQKFAAPAKGNSSNEADGKTD